MALRDRIQELVLEGRLGRFWTVKDLLACEALTSTYKESALRTEPSNNSASPCGSELGFNVKKGGAPSYYRFKPSNASGTWYCLVGHYRTGIDPARLGDPLPADVLAGRPPVCTASSSYAAQREGREKGDGPARPSRQPSSSPQSATSAETGDDFQRFQGYYQISICGEDGKDIPMDLYASMVGDRVATSAELVGEGLVPREPKARQLGTPVPGKGAKSSSRNDYKAASREEAKLQRRYERALRKFAMRQAAKKSRTPRTLEPWKIKDEKFFGRFNSSWSKSFGGGKW